MGFGEDEMRAWWHGFQPVKGLEESVIDEGQTLGGTVARILSDCWGVNGPSRLEPAQYSYPVTPDSRA